MSNPRKPTRLKIIQGTFRKDRAPKNEPKPPPVDRVPAPPRHLSVEAAKMWRKLARQLRDQGLLTGLDLGALEILCVNWGLYREMRAAVVRHSKSFAQYLKGKTTHSALHYKAMIEAFRLYRSFALEFGLTPVSRSRIDLPAAEGKPEVDIMEQLLEEP